MRMTIKDINRITLDEANKLGKKGLCFIIKDGKFKGFTK